MAVDSDPELEGFGTQIKAGQSLVSRWASKTTDTAASKRTPQENASITHYASASGDSDSATHDSGSLGRNDYKNSLNETKIEDSQAKQPAKLQSRWANVPVNSETSTTGKHHDIGNKNHEKAINRRPQTYDRRGSGPRQGYSGGRHFGKLHDQQVDIHGKDDIRNDTAERKNKGNRGWDRGKPPGHGQQRRHSHHKPPTRPSMDLGDAIRSHGKTPQLDNSSKTSQEKTSAPTMTWEDILVPNGSWADMDEEFYPTGNS